MLLLLALAACTASSEKDSRPSGGETADSADSDPGDPPDLDADDDGSPDALDCDDADPSVYPEAPETCDGRDEDCDGAVDEDAVDATLWYLDLDEDGFAGDRASASCEAPAGASLEVTDCDDDDDEVFPGAPEVCDDDVVNDCEGDPAEARAACTYEGEEEVLRVGLPFLGLEEDGRVGEALSMGGDVNGDGKDDLLIGGTNTVGPDGATGGAFLLHGPLSTNHVEYEVDASLYGEVEGEAVGGAVGLGPDMDGDGYGELVVGGAGIATWGEASGGAALFLGPVGGPHPLAHGDALLVSGGAGTRLGSALHLGADASGDGAADLAVGADGRAADDPGAVYLFFGPLSGGLSPVGADGALAGEAAGDALGASASLGGDADGDGLRDLVTGAPGADLDGGAGGAVYLALGPLDGTRAAADADAIFLGAAGDAGASLGFGGDADGDGLADLLVGAPGAGEAGAGAAALVLGPAGRGTLSLSEADATVAGAAGDALGAGVALAGDHDGDGLADLLIGRPLPEADAPGQALLWYAPALGALDPEAPDMRWLGTDAGDQLGAALCSEGDTDDDGLADLLLGSPIDDAAGTRAGSAWQIFSLGY